MARIKTLLVIFIFASCIRASFGADVPVLSLFPIEHYNQSVNYWFNLDADDFTVPLVSKEFQAKEFSQLKSHYFGTGAYDYSPWSGSYVKYLLSQAPTVAAMERRLLDGYKDANTNLANKQKINLGLNSRPYDQSWFDTISGNIDFQELEGATYSHSKMAIAINNSLLRSLPTNAPFFHSSAIAGEGYPFDNLNQTAVYIGTPLYVFAVSRDLAWSLVLTPDYIGWISSDTLAYVSNGFIKSWQKHVNNGLGEVVKRNVAFKNANDHVFAISYPGALLPIETNESMVVVYLPAQDLNGEALLIKAFASKDVMVKLPLTMNRRNFAYLIGRLQNQPYGWGNINFYNDCSSELKILFSYFGFYLPRNTKEQLLGRKNTDLSNYDIGKRLNYIKQFGKPLLTLIYTKGHIMLYVGSYRDSHGSSFIETYQEAWGLKPQDGSYREVIGKAVFFPLLNQYSENYALVSQAGFASLWLVFLDLPNNEQIKLNLKQLLQ